MMNPSSDVCKKCAYKPRVLEILKKSQMIQNNKTGNDLSVNWSRRPLNPNQERDLNHDYVFLLDNQKEDP